MSHVVKITDILVHLNTIGIKSPVAQTSVVEEGIARAVLSYLTMTNATSGQSLEITQREEILNVLNKWNEISPFDLDSVIKRVDFLNSTLRNQIITGFTISQVPKLDMTVIEGVDDYNPNQCPEFKALFSALLNELIVYCK